MSVPLHIRNPSLKVAELFEWKEVWKTKIENCKERKYLKKEMYVTKTHSFLFLKLNLSVFGKWIKNNKIINTKTKSFCTYWITALGCWSYENWQE